MLKFLLILVIVQYASGYSRGAPGKVCESMVPGHRATPKQDGSPYTISAPVEKCRKDVTVQSYQVIYRKKRLFKTFPTICHLTELGKNGTRYSKRVNSHKLRYLLRSWIRRPRVTLSGSDPFMGFLCQPRPEIHTAETKGTFTPLGDVSLVQDNCETMTSLCHASNATKTSVQFIWTPEGDETVYIVCSFVKKYDEFWLKQNSSAIKINTDDSECSSASLLLPSVSFMSVITSVAVVLLRLVMT